MNTLAKELFLNGDPWTALAGLSFVALAGLIVIAAATKKRMQWRWITLCLIGTVAGIAGTVICGHHPNDLMVQNSGAQLLLSPFSGAEVKGVLEPGEKVRAGKSHGEFAYVTTPSGTFGWVEKGRVSRYVGQW